MTRDLFPDFSENSRVWIYAFRKPLNDSEKQGVGTVLTDFVKNWKSHGFPVRGDYVILHNQFIVLVAADNDDVSGCSIDSSVAVLKRIRFEYKIDALSRNLVFYRHGEAIQSTERREFEKMVKSGQIASESIVFDTSLQTLKELRSGLFEIPFKSSWHQEAFG